MTPESLITPSLSSKHKSTMSKTAATYKATVETPHGPRTCFEVRVERSGRQPQVARFGGIPLARRKDAALVDRVPKPVIYPVKGLTVRLRTGRRKAFVVWRPGHRAIHDQQPTTNAA